MANKETLELVDFLASFANAVYSSFEDGVLNIKDLGNFLNSALSAPNAFQGTSLIIEEIKNWTAEEKAQVILLFGEKLDFEGNDLEGAVEDIFTAVVLLISGFTKLGVKA